MQINCASQAESGLGLSRARPCRSGPIKFSADGESFSSNCRSSQIEAEMASTINSPTLFDRLRHGSPIAALDVRSAAEFAIGHLRVCWQLKQREALLLILQLSALEDERVELASKGESAETEVA